MLFKWLIIKRKLETLEPNQIKSNLIEDELNPKGFLICYLWNKNGNQTYNKDRTLVLDTWLPFS